MKIITILEALEALDSLDDICRIGDIKAIGPINVLLDFIEQQFKRDIDMYANYKIEEINNTLKKFRALNK